jgi:tetratricopeptide (TPR) repeat protein
MAKVVKFPGITPEKFGLQRVRKKKKSDQEKHGQLNLFSGGKIIRLNRLSLIEEALAYEDLGDVTTAKEAYLKAIELEEEAIADAYCNLGILEFEEGLTTQAIDHFTLCLKHEPRHFEAHYNLANIYAEVGNLKLAKVHYQVSIEIEPAFPNSYYNLGLTLALNKEFKEAIDMLNQYRRISPFEDHKHTDELINQLMSAL